MATRAMTSDEIAAQRGKSSTRLYLAVAKYNTIFTAQLAAVPSSTDKVASIQFTNGSGSTALGNVKQDMTLLVGTQPGGRDLGVCRIRKKPLSTATTLDIGETSEVKWTAGAYLTVTDEFGLWPRHPRIVGTTVYMDYDIAYSDQHTQPPPVLNMGPHAVVWLTGSSVSVKFYASSWRAAGGRATYWLWTAPGATSVTDQYTDHPTITYSNPGFYRVYCTEQATGNFGVRYVWVFSDSYPPITSFNVRRIEGDFSGGGWSFDVELYDQASQSDIVPGALCVLFARDRYGDEASGSASEYSIGPYMGRENIVAMGYIDGDSISWSPDRSVVTFSVVGLQEMMKKVQLFPTGLEWTSSVGSWTNFPYLTVDRALWHLFNYRSTLCRIADFTPTGNTLYTREASSPAALLWDQAVEFASQIDATIGVDQYGCVFAFQDSQLIPDASIGTIPVIQTIGKEDHAGAEIIESHSASVSQVILSGVNVQGTTIADAIFALAPGHVYKRFGQVETKDNLLLADQASANKLASRYLAWRNNSLPDIVVKLPNHRMCTLFPAQFYSLSISSSDTVRGVSYSGYAVPRHVSYEYENGELRTEIRLEARVADDIGVVGDAPPSLEPLPPLPPLPPIPWPSNAIGPRNVAVVLAYGGIWFTTNFHEEAPRWYSANAGLPSYFLSRVMSVTIVNGRLYFAVQPYNKDAAIYYAPSVGSAVRRIVDKAWLLEHGYLDGEGYEPLIGGIGKIGSNLLAMFVNYGSALTSTANDIWRWSGTLWTMVEDSSIYLKPAAYARNWTSYGGGGMIFTYAAPYSEGHISFIDSAGHCRWDVWHGVGVDVCRCGTSKVLGIETWNAVEHRHWVSYDNGGDGTVESWTELTTVPTGFSIRAINASGSRIFIMSGNAVYKSSDGGVTWVDTNAGGGGNHALCLDDDQWLVATAGKILYTPDFGFTWIDKTSDLAEALERYGSIIRIFVF